MNTIHCIVSAGGLMVLLGWATGFDPIVYIHDGYVTMKIATAMGFVMAAPMQHEYTRPAAAIAMACMMSATFGAGYGGYVIPDVSEVETVAAGVPSLATGACFLLLTGSAFARHYKWPAWLPVTALAIAAITLIGYLLGVPFLRFHVPELSTAMAIHTAALFVLWAFADWWESRV